MASLEAMFANQDFLRKRLHPQPGEPGYLHRADLLLALQGEATSETVTILDYGAGVSPFRSLFPNSDYRRADIVAFGAPDYLIDAQGTVPEKSRVFDVVLSTQVLTHVEDPKIYLSECFRLLKPGGKLILTTNGSIAESYCPNDFHRWTAEGLRRELEQVGFESITTYKVSTGPRAVMYFIERYFYTMATTRRAMPGLLHWAGATVFRCFHRWIHLYMDRYYSAYRVVPSDVLNQDVYINLLASARRSLCAVGLGQLLLHL
jgi:SAM-dependent methyltransferase